MICHTTMRAPPSGTGKSGRELKYRSQRRNQPTLRRRPKPRSWQPAKPRALRRRSTSCRRSLRLSKAPGYDEDVVGRPFVGRSGKLLDRMMAAIGLDRNCVYIANVVPWRPPGNRTPTPQETATCLPFIRRQIELADPEILVCLGGPAMQTLLGIKDGITRSRGRWFAYQTSCREIRALATFHPAFLLRSPLQKRFAWRDFLALKRRLADGHG